MTIEEIKAKLDAWVPRYIKQTIDCRPGDTLSANELEYILNLLIKQGDDTAASQTLIQAYIEKYAEVLADNATKIETAQDASEAVTAATEAATAATTAATAATAAAEAATTATTSVTAAKTAATEAATAANAAANSVTEAVSSASSAATSANTAATAATTAATSATEAATAATTAAAAANAAAESVTATPVNNLNSTDTAKALSANMGRELNENKLDKTKLTDALDATDDSLAAKAIAVKAVNDKVEARVPTTGTEGQILKRGADGSNTWGDNNATQWNGKKLVVCAQADLPETKAADTIYFVY